MATPLLPLGSAAPGSLLPPAPSAPAPAGQGLFSRVLEHYLSEANSQNAHAQQAVLDLAAGKTNSLHGVVLEVAKSDLTFRLLLQVRNRLTEAYQEIMKMQV